MSEAFDALGFDPAPGDLGRVDMSAEQYQRVRDQLGFARDAVSAIVNQTGIWEGEASEAFARRVGDLPKHLDAAARSMSQAAAVLTDWHAELSELQRRAWELGLQARKSHDAAEAARNDPAFGLVNQMFSDPDELRAANQALTDAHQRLDSASADVDAVLASAERLRQQHDEAAHRIAGLLDKALDLAPDDPGVLGRCLEAASDAVTTAGLTFVEAHMDAARIVGDVIEDNANVIANASDVLDDASTLLAAAGDGLDVVPVLGQIGDQALTQATIYANLRQYWMPRDLRHGLEYAVGPGGIAVALENAVADGIDEDNATQAERERERAEERVWE